MIKTPQISQRAPPPSYVNVSPGGDDTGCTLEIYEGQILTWFWVKRNNFCQPLVACGKGPLPPCAYLRVPPNGGKPKKFSGISIENSASVWIFGSLLTNSQSRLGLTGSVIFLTVVSSVLTGARLYEFSRHLEYYLWYTLANSPIGFWNRLNLPLQWPDTSLGTLNLLLEPQLYPTFMCGANCKIIDIC